MKSIKGALLLCLLISFQVLSASKQEKIKSRFEELELFNKVLHLIESQYYREVNTDKLIEGAINGMLETLDPHSSYLNEKYFEKMQNDTSGEFGGIGIEVTKKDENLYVVTCIDDTPSFKAGVRSRDKIMEIEHESVQGWTLEQAIEKMRGKTGQSIHLGIARQGEKGLKHFTIVRETIKVKPVKFALVDDNYAFVRLTQFQKDSASSIEKALKDIADKSKPKGGVKGIILDLRSNPGGLLDQAVDVSSLFLNEGVVVSTESRDPQNKDIRYVKKSGYKDLKTPLIVLVNGSSASASEIVAGALQDHKRAIIMGSQTFGKGSVQTVAQIDEKSGLKLTIAQYMTPLNRKIQAVGIEPDIKLDEMNAQWAEKFKEEDNSIREKDLKNHLTATIETPEEKEHRLIDEKNDREKRIRRMKARAALKDKKEETEEEDIFKTYEPNEDYQVIQAVNYLRSYKIFKHFINADKKS